MNSEKLVLPPDTSMRFWRKVSLSSPAERYPGIGKCWIWEGLLSPQGYGRFYVGRRSLPAHRVAYQISERTLSRNEFACHKCDNPACVRPDHIFIGTQKDNVDDMMKKGRQVSGLKVKPECAARGDRHGSRTQPERVCRGERNPSSRLTEDQVREIRRRYSTGLIWQKTLALQFGVTTSNIKKIIARTAWKHIP